MQVQQLVNQMESDQDQRISETIRLERTRLQNFIRKRVPDRRDADDILQDVFYELIEAYRLMKPITHVSAWLFRVARNRITDLFRKKTTEALIDSIVDPETTGALSVEDMLPSPEAGPEAAFARTMLLEEIVEALSELSQEQRDVFIAHEVNGRSFKEISAETGINVNTLLSRKHSAVLYLRRRLQEIYDEFTEGRG